ncbi:MAG: GatB/YqeY domain-containing protein [Chloroflexi bacterium]|nr:GatB/YqeY domain-containing protein [Chloroflexota bacterium]
MDLKERLMEDMKQAMRSHDDLRRDTIRLVRAAIKNAEIDMQREADDAKVMELIAREIRQRVEAIELFRQGRRDDLVAKAQAEIAVLEAYLPRQLSEEEIRTELRRIVAEQGATGLGALGSVMRQAMAELKGKADGRLVNQIAREILSS